MNIVVLISANAEWRVVEEILTSTNIESTPMGETFTFKSGGAEIRYFHGGWGKVSAAATAQYVLDHWQPDLLVNLGTCGGFAGRVERGTIILVEKTILYDIIEQMENPEEAIAHYTTEMDLGWLDHGLWKMGYGHSPVVRGLLISADRDIVVSEIEELVQKYGAIAADWESGAIAWVAKRNGVRCLILRGVTDLVSPEGGEAYGDIGIFHENTRKVMKELVEGLEGWIRQ